MMTVISKQGVAEPCVMKVLQREGLTGIVVQTWCGETRNASMGLIQLPDAMMSKCCAKCKTALGVGAAPVAGASGV